jgi:hypothetical protein
MSRAGSTGEAAVAIARRRARDLAREATAPSLIETAMPARAFLGAAQWLDQQAGRREVVVLSDFQVGALDSVDLAQIPAGIGVRLDPIAIAQNDSPLRAPSGNRLAQVSITDARSVVDWSLAETRIDTGNPLLLAGRDETRRASAARSAAATLSASMPSDSSRRIVVLYKEYPAWSTLTATARPIDQPWMGDVVARLLATTTLTDAAMAAVPVKDPSLNDDRFIVVARDSAGAPVIVASRGEIAGRTVLQFSVLADAGSPASAALLASLPAALSAHAAGSELEPNAIPPGVLSRWQRRAGPPIATGPEGDSDGRWLWIVALVLIALESYVRRTSKTRPTEAAVPDHDQVQRVA